VLSVGDAAGQVKPTTGGGLYLGALGAMAAADVLREVLARDDLSTAR
jgi:flavin-dependent dehydrogenase